MSNEQIGKVGGKNEPLFVGYLNALPKGLFGFLALVIIGFIGGGALTAFFASANIQDPGDGRFRFDLGRQAVIGKLQYLPYPVLRLPATEGQPAKAYMLSGFGKRGAIERGEEFKDRLVRAEGVLIERGELSMLQLAGARRGLNEPDVDMADDFDPSAPVPLGKWRLKGEICDGKCYVGAMRPGRGLAHKACANLCLFDGVPPVFVAEGDVDGESFFLLTDLEGGFVHRSVSEYTGLYISVEGYVERVDDIAVFKADFDSVKVLP